MQTKDVDHDIIACLDIQPSHLLVILIEMIASCEGDWRIDAKGFLNHAAQVRQVMARRYRQSTPHFTFKVGLAINLDDRVELASATCQTFRIYGKVGQDSLRCQLCCLGYSEQLINQLVNDALFRKNLRRLE